jgi:hypothetical protein
MVSKADMLSLSKEFNIPQDNIRKVLAVESGGQGFDKTTGKIIIQFEPSWFKRLFFKWRDNIGVWATNGVEKQPKEWEAFNNAFSKNPTGAMESTSIGSLQIMGFHWKKLGFSSVGTMWEYAKKSEANQLRLGLMFIKTNAKMYKALQISDWDTFAYFYNGAQYKKFRYAERLRDA